MSTDRPLLRRRRVFAARVETTTGAALNLENSHGAINAFDRELTPEVEMIEREAQGSLSRLSSVPGRRQGTIEVTTHLHGAGGTGLPYWANTLLLAAGFAESGGVYGLSSTSETTLTTGILEDGRLRRIAGAKANLEMTFSPGEPVSCNWTLLGKLLQPGAQTMITPTYPTVKPPRFAAATLTIGGDPFVRITEMTLNLNNELVLRQDAGADDDAARSGDGTGFRAAAIVNRNVTISFNPEAVAFATKNWYADMLNAAEAAMVIELDGGVNNTITINAPKVQAINVQPGDRDGIQVDEVELQCNRNEAGDDELTITFT